VAGATMREVLEAVEVGIEMGGGPATVSARFALEVMDRVFPGEMTQPVDVAQRWADTRVAVDPRGSQYPTFKETRKMSVIRRARPLDADAIGRIYNHYISNTIVTFEESPLASGEIADRIDKVVSASLPWIVLEQAGQVAGYAYARSLSE
jgi:hypothetical protein